MNTVTHHLTISCTTLPPQILPQYTALRRGKTRICHLLNYFSDTLVALREQISSLALLMFSICGFRITKLCWLWVLENWQFCSNKKESWTKNKQIVNTLCWTYLTFYFFLSTKEILPLFRSVYQHQPEYILW